MIVGIGCDLCKIERVNDEIAIKILTDKEMLDFNQLHNARKKEWLAGRFAAKEAIIKATGIQMMKEIEISSTKEGKPLCNLEGYTVHLTISHDGEYAMAMVVIENV